MAAALSPLLAWRTARFAPHGLARQVTSLLLVAVVLHHQRVSGTDEDTTQQLATLTEEVNASCSALPAASLQQVLVALKHYNLHFNSQDPLTILLPVLPSAPVARSLMQFYADTYAVPITIDTPTNLPPNFTAAYDYYYASSSTYDAVLWLSTDDPMVALDALASTAVTPVAGYALGLPEAAAQLEDDKTLPPAFYPSQSYDTWMILMYNTRMVAANNITVPTTWYDLLQIASTFNGTDLDGDGQVDAALCLDLAPVCKAGSILSAIYASIAQTDGEAEGVWFDQKSFQPLFPNPAMAEALRLMGELSQYGASDTCDVMNANFKAGNCLITLDWVLSYVYSKKSQYAAKMVGNVGFARVPGSSVVWVDEIQSDTNDASNLVACGGRWSDGTSGRTDLVWNKSVCPKARKVAGQGGTEQYVNFAALTSTVPITTSSTADTLSTNPLRETTTVVMLSWLKQQFSQHFTTMTALYFYADNVTDDQWAASDYTKTELVGGLLPLWQDMNQYSDTNARDIAIPFNQLYNLALDKMALSAVNGTSDDVDAIMAQGLEDFAFVQQVYPYSHTLLLYYKAMLNSTGRDRRTTGSTLDVSLLIAMLVPTLTVLATALLLWRLWMKQRRLNMLGKAGPPGVGESTSLVVTDIQSSTTLWEALPAEVMDSAIRAHHRCIRGLLSTYNGYESATEGDSFICSFHRPSDAVAFCSAAQVGLLNVDWHPELLRHPEAREVAVQPRQEGAMREGRSGGGNALSAEQSALADSVLPSPTGRQASGSAKQGQHLARSPLASFLSAVGEASWRIGLRPSKQHVLPHVLSSPSLAQTSSRAASPQTRNRSTSGTGLDTAAVSDGSVVSWRQQQQAQQAQQAQQPRYMSMKMMRPPSASLNGTSLGAEWTLQSEMLSGHDSGGASAAVTSASHCGPPPDATPTASACASPHTAFQMVHLNELDDHPLQLQDTLLPDGGGLTMLPSLQPDEEEHEGLRSLRDLVNVPLFHNAMAAAFNLGWHSSSGPASSDRTTSSTSGARLPHDDGGTDENAHNLSESGNTLLLGLGWTWSDVLKALHSEVPLDSSGRREMDSQTRSPSRFFRASNGGAKGSAAVVIFRGLRVRMGIHSGIAGSNDLVFDKTTQRVQFTGAPLALAKAVADAAHGGMVLLSASAFAQLSNGGSKSGGASKKLGHIVVYAGQHDLGLAPKVYAAAQQPTSRAAIFQHALSADVKPGAGHKITNWLRRPALPTRLAGSASAMSSGSEARPAAAAPSTVNVQLDAAQALPVQDSSNGTTTVPHMHLHRGASGLYQCRDVEAPAASAVNLTKHHSTTGGTPPVGSRQGGGSLRRHEDVSLAQPQHQQQGTFSILQHLTVPRVRTQQADTSHNALLPAPSAPQGFLRLMSRRPGHAAAEKQLGDSALSAPPGVDIYMLTPLALQARLGRLGAVRSKRLILPGTLSAPMPAAAIAFMHAYGASMLLADLPVPARAAMAIFSNCVLDQLSQANGYLVELSDGFVLAAFPHPALAIAWALACNDELNHQAWPEEILENDLCREGLQVATRADSVAFAARADSMALTADVGGCNTSAPLCALHSCQQQQQQGDQQQVLPSMHRAPARRASRPVLTHAALPRSMTVKTTAAATAEAAARTATPVGSPRARDNPSAHLGSTGSSFKLAPAVVVSRGLRVRTGIDVGAIRPELHPTTGRMVYRGRVMNRAARISAKASPGQVLSSALGWALSMEHEAVTDAGIHAHELGAHELKGVAEPMQLVACTRHLGAAGMVCMPMCM